MPFKEGKPKTGGRKKGVANKRTRELQDFLDEKNFNPAAKLILIYRKAMKEYGRAEDVHDIIEDTRRGMGFKAVGASDQGPTYLGIALSAAKDLMQYVYPKRKAIEHTGKDGSPLQNYLDMTPEERAERRAAYEKRLGRVTPRK
jgi:hypothetical protein